MINKAVQTGRRLAANHGGANAPVLVGIKRQDCHAPSEAALRLGRKLAERGEIAYWVVSDDGRSTAGTVGDLRAHPRERNRLRSAKLLDGGCRFLSEGRICDRSRDGLRVAVTRDVRLPPRLAVHIDETSEVRVAAIVWRRGSTIGLRLGPAAPANLLRPCDRRALSERYYAIPG